jgi:hypothetical protein
MANKPTNPQLYSRVKAEAKKKFDRWPSAYGSAWLVKEYKRRGGGYRKAEDGMEIPGYDLMANGGMMYGDYQFPFMDEGGEMALGQIAAVTDKMSKLQQFLNSDSDVEPWVASKLAVMDDSAGAIYDYMMYNPEAQESEGEDMEEMRDGGIPKRYKNQGFTRVGAKRQSTRPGKKWMVLAKKGDKYKVVHGGYKGMSDYTQHRNKNRQKKFWDRMGGRDSAKAKDPFSPLYWHKRFGTWAEGGEPQNEGFQALPEEVQAKIMANMMYGGDMYQKGGENDSTLENILEVFDPTGITSWDDVYRAATNPKASKEEVALEVFGALPFLGKLGKAGKYVAMAGDAFAVTARQKRNAQAVAAAMRAVPYVGRATDAAQAVQQAPTAPLFPKKKDEGNFVRNIYADSNRSDRLQDSSFVKPIQGFKKGGTPFIAMAYFRDGGIELDPAKKGTFKAQATRMGLSVQEAAKKILDAPEGKYSPEMRRKANFARNFAKEYGGMPEYQFAGSTEEPFFELQTPITGLQPKGFDMRMFDSLEETKKRMENPSDLIQPASPIKPIEPKRGFSLANQAAYVTGIRALEALTRDNSAEKRYRASQTLTDAYAPVQRMNPFDWYGEYVTNQGDLLNPRQMAPVQFRGMDYPMYMEEGGQVVELDDTEIKQLLALGAEIEMID